MKILSKIGSDTLFYLLIFSFIFVSSFTLSLNKTRILRYPRMVLVAETKIPRDFPPVPILTKSENLPDFSAESIFAFDVNSGVTLYSKNPDERLLPASTTKMITALTAMDYYDLNSIIKVGKIRVEGQKMGLKEGEEISVGNLISGLLIYSANDAAEILAQNYCLIGVDVANSCGREEFINAMNNKAKEIHLDNSTFTNPTGLDMEGHFSTARDLSRIATVGMNNPIFRQIVGTKETTVLSVNGNQKHKLTNLNQLLGEVNGVLGIKTGWTENAKENLVTYIERDGKTIVIVFLGSKDRFGETKKLINWIFDSYEWKKVAI